MPTRQATAEWKGTLKEGKGQMRVESGAFEGPYSFQSRTEDGQGTNPEELIGAAHAGCHAMALSLLLSEDGLNPGRIQTTAKVHLEKTDDGLTITKIDLSCEGEVEKLKDEQFQEYATMAKKNCVISRALKGVEITLEAKLLTAA